MLGAPTCLALCCVFHIWSSSELVSHLGWSAWVVLMRSWAWWVWGCPRITSTKQQVLVVQSCLILYKSMDCSLPGSSARGILQARILEWVTIPFSGGFSWPRDQTRVSCIAGRFFIVWATREAPMSKLRVGEINRSQWLSQNVGAGVGWERCLYPPSHVGPSPRVLLPKDPHHPCTISPSTTDPSWKEH